MNHIYRKSSLEKLSSPEQLDKMIHITKISAWLYLLGMFAIILAASYWAFFGEINEKIGAQGIYLEPKEASAATVLCYVPLSTGKKIKEGMQVNLVPSTVDEKETGYLLGIVKKVGDYGVSEEEMKEKLGDDLLVQAFRSQSSSTEPVIEIEIALSGDKGTVSGYAWSNERGAFVSLSDFTLVSAYIITQTMTPFDMFAVSIS